VEAIVTSSRSGSHSPLPQRKPKVAYLMLPPLVADPGGPSRAGASGLQTSPRFRATPGPRFAVGGPGPGACTHRASGFNLNAAPGPLAQAASMAP
jgi:hypothetical protein